MKRVGYENVIIWGLRNKRHSHRYIHQGYFETFSKMDIPTYWVDDLRKNRNIVGNNSLVMVAGIASKEVPIVNSATYILHNTEESLEANITNKIKLQVFSKAAHGVSIDDTISLWDQDTKTLFQPWGLAEDPTIWKNPINIRKTKEYWIGAIWNNSLKQGNSLEIYEYKKILRENGLRFIRKGGTRSVSISGISPDRGLELVNKSAIGAAIVGNWQKENLYIPCRSFKNIAAGAIPISNANYKFIYGESFIHIDSLEELVSKALELSHSEKLERNMECRRVLKNYQYKSNVKRILSLLK